MTIPEDTANPSARHPALKPCPFCGGSAIIYAERSISGGEWFYYALCDGTTPDHCSTIMPPQIGSSGDRFAVVAAWNRRAREADLVAAAQFLLDRLDEQEIPEELIRDWMGHIEPAIGRVADSLRARAQEVGDA